MQFQDVEDPQSRHILLKHVITNDNETKKKPVKFWFSKRFFVAILAFFISLNESSLVYNLSMALVEMTDTKTITINNETIIQDAEFDWDSKMKGFLISVFAYGYASALFGSNLPIKFGGSTMISITVAISSLMAILTPIIIRFNFYLYILVRILEGTCQGITYVSFSELWSKWAPIQERSKLMSVGFAGFYVAGSVVYPICGLSIRMFGWPAAFYVTGASGLISGLLWFACVPNDPQDDRWISKEELQYIKENQIQKKRPKNLMSVWKNILTSKCIWALGSCKFAYIMGHNFVVKCFPMYIKDVTNVKIDKIGILSAAPNVLCILTIPLAGYMIDYLHRGKWTATQVHKTFMCTGCFIGAAALFCTSLFHLSFASTMSCFVIFKIMLSLSFIVTQVASVCLAPQCSSLVAGCLAIFYSAGSIIGPMLIGFVVTNHRLEEWNLCTFMIGIMLVVSGFMYLFWGSGDPQPWSYSADEDDNGDIRDQENLKY